MAAVTINVAGTSSLTQEEQITRWVECAKALAEIARTPVMSAGETNEPEWWLEDDRRRAEMAAAYQPDYRLYLEVAEAQLDPDEFHGLVMDVSRYW